MQMICIFLSSLLAQCNIYLSCFILKVKYISRHFTLCPCVFSTSFIIHTWSKLLTWFPSSVFAHSRFFVAFQNSCVSSVIYSFCYVYFTLIGFFAFGLTCVRSSVKTLPFWTCIPYIFLHLSVFCTQTTKKLDIVTSYLCFVMYLKNKIWK